MADTVYLLNASTDWLRI